MHWNIVISFGRFCEDGQGCRVSAPDLTPARPLDKLSYRGLGIFLVEHGH